MLGGVAGLVLLVIVVAILAMSGGDDPVVNPGGGGDPVAGGGQPAEKSMTEKIAELEREYLKATATKDLAAIQSVYTRAKALTASGLARKAAQYALDNNGNLEWANEELGRKDLRKVFSKIPTADQNDLLNTYPNTAYNQLIEAREYAETSWGTTERYIELEKLLREATSHGEKLKNDRDYLDEYVIRLNVSKDPLYKDYPYRVSAAGPYIMFVEHTGSESDSEKARKIVERNLNVLTCLYRDFRKVFGEHFEMPDVKSFENPSMRTLKLWTFFSRKSFHEYQEKLGRRLPAGVAAYYMPSNQWITLFESPGGGGGGTDFNINKIFHEGTHQLVHLYTKVMLEKKLGEEILWSDNRTHSRLHWFQEGTAEFFGSADKKGDNDWETMVPYTYRMREWWMTKSNKLSEWSFEELLSIRTSSDLQRLAAQKGLGQAGRLSSLFYAQAWSWVYFLWNFEDGKYRKKYLEYAAKEFHGVSGPEEFAKTWGAGSDYDWTPIKNQWEKFTEKVGKEMGIWK